MKRLRVSIIVGTRPEAIKLAPVILGMRKSPALKPVVVSTSQHRDLAAKALASFSIEVDHILTVGRPGKSLGQMSGSLAHCLGTYFEEHSSTAALVQGDTSTALMGALMAFYHRVPVGHVEAGLRTGDSTQPFPEEMHRLLIGKIAKWHFAPTRASVQHLRKEGVPADNIYLTGNTVIDAIKWIQNNSTNLHHLSMPWVDPEFYNFVLVTCHRRENFGKPLQRIAHAIARLASRNPRTMFVVPLHSNPEAATPMHEHLHGKRNVTLTQALDYDVFLSTLRHASVVLTDSGGVQEEATALGKCVLVMREKTERMEGVKAGNLRLVGTDSKKIEDECQKILIKKVAHALNSKGKSAFGDGHSSARIVRILESSLSNRIPLG